MGCITAFHLTTYSTTSTNTVSATRTEMMLLRCFRRSLIGRRVVWTANFTERRLKIFFGEGLLIVIVYYVSSWQILTSFFLVFLLTYFSKIRLVNSISNLCRWHNNRYSHIDLFLF